MRILLIVVLSFALVSLCVLGGWGYSRHQREEEIRRNLGAAENALTNSNVRLALQLAEKIPEGTPQFKEAQDIEVKALLIMSGDVERMADEVESVVGQLAEVKIMEDRQRAELAKASPGSQQYAQIEQKLRELNTMQQTLIQSNKLTASGYGAFTEAGRNRALVLMYEQAVGHSIDDRTKSLVDSITEQRGLERDASRRKKFAESSQARDTSEGGSTTYSTDGKYDRILVIQDYRQADSETLERVSLVIREHPTTFCREGFEKVELRVPRLSSPQLTIPLDCGPSIK